MLFLLITITALLPISYCMFKKDIASPTFLFYIGFFISAVAAYFNYYTWNIHIQDRIIVIFLFGWISFFAGEYTIRVVLAKKRFSNNLGNNRVKLKAIIPSRIVVYSLVLLNIVITILLFREVVKVASFGGSSTDNLMVNFKENLDEVGLSGLITQLTKITKASAYVFAFVFINNLIAAEKRTLKVVCKNIKYLIPIMLYILQCFMRGGRYTVIAVIIGMLFIIYYLCQYKSNWRFKLSIKNLIILILIVFCIFLAFWLIKNVVGRTSESPFLEYITRYLGGPYELFSLYIENPPESAYETFAGLLTSFNKIGLTNSTIRSYHEFRFSSTGILIGNVYSAFRNYYNDYGLLGVCFFSYALSFIFNLSYHRIRVEKNLYKHSFRVIVYSAFLYCIVFAFFVDYFFARISLGLFIEVIIMYLVYYVVIKKRFYIGKNRK